MTSRGRTRMQSSGRGSRWMTIRFEHIEDDDLDDPRDGKRQECPDEAREILRLARACRWRLDSSIRLSDGGNLRAHRVCPPPIRPQPTPREPSPRAPSGPDVVSSSGRPPGRSESPEGMSVAILLIGL